MQLIEQKYSNVDRITDGITSCAHCCAAEDACVHLQPLPRAVHPVVGGVGGGGFMRFGKSSSRIIIGSIGSIVLSTIIISRIIIMIMIMIIIIIIISIIVTTIITCNEPSAAPKTSLTSAHSVKFQPPEN